MYSDNYHNGKYFVTFKRGIDDFKKDLLITIDKSYENDSLKIMLSDDDEPSFLCIMFITRRDYEELKKQQGLLIDFDNFPAQLVRLLQQCAASNMFLIMVQNNPLQYYLEVVEHNEFKRLVHLSLKTAPACDDDIKKHMSDKILHLKKLMSTLKHTASSSDMKWNEKCSSMERKIHDMSLALTKMEEDKLRKENEFQDALRREKERLAQERMEYQKSNEVALKNQSVTTQEIVNSKEKHIEELNLQYRILKNNMTALECQMNEKSQRLMVLEQEVHSAHVDLASTKAKCANFEHDLMDKDKFIQDMKCKCSAMEQAIKEKTDKINDLNSKMQQLQREKLNLEDKISLSEALASKNNEAVQCTSDQLLKANEIISKINAELIEMKEKLLCRTAIVLEQEKVIEQNAKELDTLKEENTKLAQEVEKLNTNIVALKEKQEKDEKVLQNNEEIIKNNNMVIRWLHEKIENNIGPLDSLRSGKTWTTGTNRYLSSQDRDKYNSDLTDDGTNFYDVTQTPRGDDSPKAELFQSSRTGLDPKYLQPATEDTTRKSGRNSKSTTESLRGTKGKENMTTNLPKVDYREKSVKPTYRATPISAYFNTK